MIRSGYGIAFDPISSFQVTAVSGKVPGLTFSCSSTVGGATTPGCAAVPDIRIGDGFPLELPTPNTKPSSFLTPPPQILTNAPNLTVFDQQLKLPTVHQWNLSIERELPWGMVAQVSYIGRRGTRLLRAYDSNQIKRMEFCLRSCSCNRICVTAAGRMEQAAQMVLQFPS